MTVLLRFFLIKKLAHKQEVNKNFLKLRGAEFVHVVCRLEVPLWLPQSSDAPRLVLVVGVGGAQKMQLILGFAAHVLVFVLVFVVQKPLLKPLLALDRSAYAVTNSQNSAP